MGQRAEAGKKLFTWLLILVSLGFLAAWICGIRPYIVLSGSMEPGIPTGSVVLIHTGKKTGAEGEVIAFYRCGTVVTHRILSVKKDAQKIVGYETKGDANEQKDSGLVDSRDLIGVCVGRIPYLGYGIHRLQQGRLGLYLFLAILVFGECSLRIRKKYL